MIRQLLRAALPALLVLAPTTTAAAQQRGRGPVQIQPGAPAGTAATRLREIAVTFDDLPMVFGRPPSLEEHERVTTTLVGTIASLRIPVVGFVNEDKLETGGKVDPRRVELLKQWTKAGLELGNHTYSHLDLHRVSAEQYRSDILRGEAVTRPLLAEIKKKPRFFRHPYLHTGRDTATRNSIHRFLEDKGYRVAPVTLDNYDYIFARAYDKAIASKDTDQQRRIEQEYIGYMDRILAYYEKQSIALIGRNIPHILLLHANTLNARTFDRLIAAYQKRGYTFVALEHALRDPSYESQDLYVGDAGITWLHRWAMTQGRRGTAFAGEPSVPKWIESAATP